MTDSTPKRSGRTRREVLLALVALISVGVLASCNTFRRLDEQVFHEGPQMRLKLVRHYQRYFLSYDGEVYSVQCASEATADNGPQKHQDAGWQRLQTGGAVGSTSAKQFATHVEPGFVFLDDQTLTWSHLGLSVTFDACGTLQYWDPIRELPSGMIDPVDKPSYCAPRGEADCRHYDFLGERQPQYDDIVLGDDGTLTFTVRSSAFKDIDALLVRTEDHGRTWSYEPF